MTDQSLHEVELSVEVLTTRVDGWEILIGQRLAAGHTDRNLRLAAELADTCRKLLRKLGKW